MSVSCQQNLSGIWNSVWIWWLYIGWILRWGRLWIVFPSISAPNSVSVTPSIGILFPILRRNEVPTLSSSFLSFMCFANCISGILSFWANIHLSVSAYHVCSFMIGLPHLRWYPPDPSIYDMTFIISYKPWIYLFCRNADFFLSPLK